MNESHKFVEVYNPSRFLAHARNILDIMLEKDACWDPPLELQGKEGGCLCIADQSGLVIQISFIGKIPAEKASKYWDLAIEKVWRLVGNRLYYSSWQSRDPASEKWGGAIRGEDYFYSFSGLPERMDECFMLLLANELSDLHDSEAWRIAELSSNPCWPQLAYNLQIRRDRYR